ncbi:MAG: acyl-CoA/acyl-ACP dehydrogenase [Deltaproteobacteria bacterium]|nr:acyl-CoA/acyl-ACP dehydrogenase [Deltaproteobacteria bacterium]
MKNVIEAIQALYARALDEVRERVLEGDRPSGKKLNEAQLAGHGLAYLATELEACRQLSAWAEQVGGDQAEGIANAYVAEVARTLAGGIDLGPCETVSLGELGLTDDDVAKTIRGDEVRAFIAEHGGGDAYLDIARRARDDGQANRGMGDPMLDEVQKQFAKFVDAEVIPLAQDIHRKDELIPMKLVTQMSELGVFGLTIPEEYDGLGMSKVAMCVVTEELSRGYIGVGSLGTRAEIAAELIMGGGTEEQKKTWLPRLASGEVLSTAVFTEPNHGSDLAHITTRADKDADGSYRLSGAKTWITHAVRADLMTVLARTNPEERGYAGLSMFLAEKTRLSPAPGEAEFVDEGLTGTEIPVIGYRGMKEYELSFDGFTVPGSALLGGEEGAGFKQLMRTFESARIQTAARGVGLAQAALDDAMLYAMDRAQFGRPIFEFPRVGRKIGRMVARTMAARQLAFHAARRKDSGDRCDLEAGMAKLLATRAAWEAADANVQIHGGNGYAEEYTASRLLVDARVLSIFEGANEIQAHVVARRLLEKS